MAALRCPCRPAFYASGPAPSWKDVRGKTVICPRAGLASPKLCIVVDIASATFFPGPPSTKARARTVEGRRSTGRPLRQLRQLGGPLWAVLPVGSPPPRLLYFVKKDCATASPLAVSLGCRDSRLSSTRPSSRSLASSSGDGPR